MTPENPYANPHVGKMFRHLSITAVLVAATVFIVMWVNESLFSAERTTWQDYINYYETVEPVKPPPPAVIPVAAVVAIPKQAKASFTSFSILGVAADIDIQDVSKAQSQVVAVWERFSENNDLHEAISWVNGSNPVYAYYYDINSDFNRAKLIVGYASDKSVAGASTAAVRSGRPQRFEMSANGIAPTQAWEAAYPNGVILERYDLDMQGQTSNGYVLVIK